MALTLTAYALSMGFTLSRLAFNIPAFGVRGPIATIRATDETKIIALVLTSGNTVNGAVFPSDADEQNYNTATVASARDARSVARLNGVNYVFNRQSLTGIRILNDAGTVTASNILNVVSTNGEMAETLISNAQTNFIYCVENVNTSTNNIVEVDPINVTRTIKYVSSVSVPHIAFNGTGDRFYLATNDTPTTNFRIVELTYPGFTLVQSHLIGDYNVEAILCYNPPNGAAPRIMAQIYAGSTPQFYDIDLSTDTLTALTSGSINGDGVNVDPLENRRAFLTQLNEVYKLLAPVGGSFTDSAPIPTPDPDEPTYRKGTRCDTDFAKGASCNTDFSKGAMCSTSYRRGASC